MLTAAVLAGLLAGLGRLLAAWLAPDASLLGAAAACATSQTVPAGARLAPHVPRLRWWPLAVAVLAGQAYLVFGAGLVWPGLLRAGAILVSQLLILAVVAANLARPWRGGMALAGAGLALNLAVMLANGGLMPISPQTLVAAGNGHVLARPGMGPGSPLPRSKDVVLAETEMALPWLADRIVIPGHHASYSAGDLLIASGAFLALWSAAGAAAQAPLRVSMPHRRESITRGAAALV